MGVVSRKWVWVKSMGVARGCGCKEVYRFPHITYPYSSCIYLLFFSAASLLFVHFYIHRQAAAPCGARRIIIYNSYVYI